MIDSDTIWDYLTVGQSLAICCRACTRDPVEWTPPELDRRFGTTPGLRIRALAAKLTCGGEGGCGSHDVAVYPVDYASVWKWEPRPRRERLGD
jgi:hypothetical protein